VGAVKAAEVRDGGGMMRRKTGHGRPQLQAGPRRTPDAWGGVYTGYYDSERRREGGDLDHLSSYGVRICVFLGHSRAHKRWIEEKGVWVESVIM
jgi:hypothetical protein